MKWLICFLMSFSGICLSIAEDAPLETVTFVDVDRYMGVWFEIASFPQSFQKDCTGTMAVYFLKLNGKVDVSNSCHLKTLDGELKTARGTAHVVDQSTNAKLRVSSKSKRGEPILWGSMVGATVLGQVPDSI